VTRALSPFLTSPISRLSQNLKLRHVSRPSGFEPKSGHLGFVLDKAAWRAGFLLVLRFPLPIFYSTKFSVHITWCWYSGPSSGPSIESTASSHPREIKITHDNGLVSCSTGRMCETVWKDKYLIMQFCITKIHFP
jgi:hypothetical protein